MDSRSKILAVKEWLAQGNIINDMKAVELCQSYRLSAIIFELRHKYELNIQDHWVQNEETGTRYKEYWLAKY